MFGIDVIEFGYQNLNVLPTPARAGTPADVGAIIPNSKADTREYVDEDFRVWDYSDSRIHISSEDTGTFLGDTDSSSHSDELISRGDHREVDNLYFSTDQDDYWVDHMEHSDALEQARPFDQLEREFVRDAPRTRVYIDGVEVTNFKRGFWRILKCFGWSHGARVLYMSTGDALAKSYTRGKKAIEAQFCNSPQDQQNSEFLFVQGRKHQENRIDTKNGLVVLEKSFLLVRLEPYSVQEQWRLVKTFKVKANTSVDEWTREWRRDKAGGQMFSPEEGRLQDCQNDSSFVARRICGPRFDLLQDPAAPDSDDLGPTLPTMAATAKTISDHDDEMKDSIQDLAVVPSLSPSTSGAECSSDSDTDTGSTDTVLLDGDEIRLDGDDVLTAVTWSPKTLAYGEHQHDTDATDHVSDTGAPTCDCDDGGSETDEQHYLHRTDPIVVLPERGSCDDVVANNRTSTSQQIDGAVPGGHHDGSAPVNHSLRHTKVSPDLSDLEVTVGSGTSRQLLVREGTHGRDDHGSLANDTDFVATGGSKNIKRCVSLPNQLAPKGLKERNLCARRATDGYSMNYNETPTKSEWGSGASKYSEAVHESAYRRAMRRSNNKKCSTAMKVSDGQAADGGNAKRTGFARVFRTLLGGSGTSN
eukprot:m.1638561 g.1638561  ORF g.1638561 m.1638561 type:complete len:642 (+) comp28725_c0_seq1:361-2286(+)